MDKKKLPAILPDMYCPFPSQINQYSESLKDYSIEWAIRFKVLETEADYKRFRQAEFSFLAASAYPSCQFEELKIANDWICWLLLWDDQCDMSEISKQPKVLEAFQNRFLHILQGAEITSKDIALSHVLVDFRRRILEIESHELFDTFIRTVERYFTGSLLEAKNRLNEIVPHLDTCSHIHMLSGAVETVLDLIEICNHLYLPEFVRNNQIIDELKMMTNKIICWSNDIFSAPKELQSGDVHNLVIALHHHQDLSFAEAMQIVAQMHNQEVEKMLDLEKSIPSFGEEVDSILAQYISGLHSWIRGNYDWSSRSARYQTVKTIEIAKY
ncbi:terpene synthase family protein [Anabaena azotica]|uniref:Terpene synthase n=1 Tax=Anabaena azotica FACHB-119 TaxID=947527 RepID=A0ABR8DDH7_9NOST|nr:terpene synthase [Anabaena azotica]MBD2504694.1 terpene synthase [Anabaena azotica FACHB-119]